MVRWRTGSHPAKPGERRRARGLAVALAPLLLSGCGGDAVDLVREIDAARDGCTEDRLREGAEECVQMFERYAEMGTDALETYIGAMRAFDEALQRRGPQMFDTTGFGRAISPGLYPGPGADASPERRSGNERPLSGQRSEPRFQEDPGGWREEGALAVPPGSGGVQQGWGLAPDPRPFPESAPWGGDRVVGDPFPDRVRMEPAPTVREARPPPRGALLPPEERLRRPWLDDAPAPERDRGEYEGPR